MSEIKPKTKPCPMCGVDAEVGSLLGNSAFSPFRWHVGNPSLWKYMIPFIGDYLGEADITTGAYLKGLRCNNCKKLILDLDY